MPKANIAYTSEEVMSILKAQHEGDVDIKIVNPRKPRDPNAPKRTRKPVEAVAATAGTRK